MDTLQQQALSVVFFPEKNMDNNLLFHLLDFLRKHEAGNIQFNNTFPLGIPAPFPLISAKVDPWQIIVNGQRIDFSCQKVESFGTKMALIYEIFKDCFNNKIKRLGLVAQFKCGNITLSRFLNPTLLNTGQDFSLNSLTYVNKLNAKDVFLFDNIQILKNNSQEFPYVCVRDLNTGLLPAYLDEEYLGKVIKISMEKFSLNSIREELYGKQ